MGSRYLAMNFLLALLVFKPASSWAQQAKLKNLVNIKGVRSNTLIGYGVVFGLQATGDTAASVTTRQAVAKMLTQLGMKTSSEDLVSGNYASVIATAELPPFARSGDRIDIRLSANGDASSLAGGTLLMTPLRAGDGKIYAVGQGAVVVGQAVGAGPEVLTVATVPGGGLVEREFSPEFAPHHKLTLSLKRADFTTNDRIVKRINEYFRGFYARSLDPGTVMVMVPPPFHERIVAFISQMEGLTVEIDRKAVVVLNERTGTVVMGSDIVIAPVTIAHGNLAIKVNEPATKTETENALIELKGTTVGDVVQSLNALGVKPKDLVAIIQAIHAAGALQGELKFM